jgi:hypothetical protein
VSTVAIAAFATATEVIALGIDLASLTVKLRPSNCVPLSA